jgi:hypothetical protein
MRIALRRNFFRLVPAVDLVPVEKLYLYQFVIVKCPIDCLQHPSRYPVPANLYHRIEVVRPAFTVLFRLRRKWLHAFTLVVDCLLDRFTPPG